MKAVIEYLENKKVISKREIVGMDMETVVGSNELFTPENISVNTRTINGVGVHTLSFDTNGERVNLTECGSESDFNNWVRLIFKPI